MSDSVKRERKQAELYKVAAPTHVAKQITIQVKCLYYAHGIIQRFPLQRFSLRSLRPMKYRLQKGKGIQLSEYPFFVKGLEKIKADDETVKSLHLLLFATSGKKLEVKKNIRLFSGYDAANTKDERHVKVTENKKKWTTQLLKNVLSLFGLEKSGVRSDLIDRLLDYLLLPTMIKDVSASAEQNKKNTKPVPSKGTKRKAKGDGNAPKKVKSPSGYILFCGEARVELKATKPDATFAEISALLGQKWQSADENEKKKWNDLAAEKANNKDSTEEEVNEEEDDEEEKDGDDDDEKDGDDVDEVAEKDDTAENEEIKGDKADVEIDHADVAKEGAGDVEKLGDNEKKSSEEVETDDAPLEKDA